jgi:hypothetical protein
VAKVGQAIFISGLHHRAEKRGSFILCLMISMVTTKEGGGKVGLGACCFSGFLHFVKQIFLCE